MNPMQISATGLAFIADQESFVDHIYPDIGGLPTIGFGHVVKRGDPTTVTRDQAMVLLRHDAASAESAVNHDVKVQITQAQFDALCSFAFNEGCGALTGSTLLRLLNAGDFAGAAREFLKWTKYPKDGVLTYSQGLYNRRVAEATMFLGMSALDARLALGLSPDPEETLRPVTESDVSPVPPETTQPTPPEDEDA